MLQVFTGLLFTLYIKSHVQDYTSPKFILKCVVVVNRGVKFQRNLKGLLIWRLYIKCVGDSAARYHILRGRGHLQM